MPVNTLPPPADPVATNSTQPPRLAGRGRARAALGRWKEADDDFAAALRLKPDEASF